jgi:hypothetical protein
VSECPSAGRVVPSRESQSQEKRRNTLNAKRVPSYLTVERQREAVREVRAGRSVHQVAKDKSVSEAVILELYQRDLERRTRDLMAGLSARLDEMEAELRGARPARRQVA